MVWVLIREERESPIGRREERVPVWVEAERNSSESIK